MHSFTLSIYHPFSLAAINYEKIVSFLTVCRTENPFPNSPRTTGENLENMKLTKKENFLDKLVSKITSNELNLKVMIMVICTQIKNIHICISACLVFEHSRRHMRVPLRDWG